MKHYEYTTLQIQEYASALARIRDCSMEQAVTEIRELPNGANLDVYLLQVLTELGEAKTAPAEKEELDIDMLPEEIEKLRARWLYHNDGSYLDCDAEQYFLLALNALEQAERFAKLALYKTRKVRAIQQYGKDGVP